MYVWYLLPYSVNLVSCEVQIYEAYIHVMTATHLFSPSVSFFFFFCQDLVLVKTNPSPAKIVSGVKDSRVAIPCEMMSAAP